MTTAPAVRFAALLAAAWGLSTGSASAEVIFTPFPILDPTFISVFNDRIGNSRLFNGPNTDRLRVSVGAVPSPDSDKYGVELEGNLYRSTNGGSTTVSVGHSAFIGSRPLGFIGHTSGGGGSRNEYTATVNLADPVVAPLLDAFDATPFTVTVKNPHTLGGVTQASFTAPDYDKTALPGFVRDLSLTGGGLTPRLDWTLPEEGTTATSARIQIRLIDEIDNGRITKSRLVHNEALAPGATSFTFSEFLNNDVPDFPKKLAEGSRYEIAVILDVVSGGVLKGRSRTFFEFSPLDAGAPGISVFLPSVGPNGVFKFDVAVRAGEKIAIDPDVAIGYDYQIGTGDPLFASVILPEVGDNLFELYLFDGTQYIFEALLAAGVEYFFSGGGVERFRVLGIETSAGLDPFDVTAFITILTFAGDGRFTGTMTSIVASVAPAPGTLALLLLGFIALAHGGMRRSPAPLR